MTPKSVTVTTATPYQVYAEPARAFRERADSCAVPAAAVVGEAMVAVVLAEALLDKFGHDNMTDIRASHDAYRQRLRDAIRSPEGARRDAPKGP